MSIKLTESAVEQVRKSAEEGGMQNLSLRIAAQRRPDGSIEYAMGYDEQNDADTTREYDGFVLVVAPQSIDLLSGAILDYVTMDDGQQQFIFLNPNDPGYIPPLEHQ